MVNQRDQIVWKHMDGSLTLIRDDISDEDLLRVFEEAFKTMKGQFPSINSRETIEDILNFYE